MTNSLSMLNASTSFYIWIGILGIFIILCGVIFGVVPVGLWFKGIISGTHIYAHTLTSLHLRKLDVNLIVNSYIALKKAGIDINIKELETHYIAGGNIKKVTESLLSAKTSNINISVKTALALDIANRDVLELVKNNNQPIVLTSNDIKSISKDGIELIVKIRVTLTCNLNKLLDSINEEELISKISEIIVATISNTSEHTTILQNPNIISTSVLTSNLDNNTAYSIRSIDIVDIMVGSNVGARLMAEKAEADMQIAKNKAEERHRLALAKTQEKQAELLDAEAEIPKALSTAFRSGKIGVMDFYKMRDLMSDKNKDKSKKW